MPEKQKDLKNRLDGWPKEMGTKILKRK